MLQEIWCLKLKRPGWPPFYSTHASLKLDSLQYLLYNVTNSQMSSSNWQFLVMEYSVEMFGWEWKIFLDVLFDLEITMYTICTVRTIKSGHINNGWRTLHSEAKAIVEPSLEFQEQIIALVGLAKSVRESRTVSRECCAASPPCWLCRYRRWRSRQYISLPSRPTSESVRT